MRLRRLVRPIDLLRMWHTKIEGWILEQASDIQMIADKELEVAVGKPWSFSDIITKSSEEKNSNESENDSENQE